MKAAALAASRRGRTASHPEGSGGAAKGSRASAGESGSLGAFSKARGLSRAGGPSELLAYAALAFVILSVAQTVMVIPFMARSMRAAQDFQHPDEPKVIVADNGYSIDLNEFSNPAATAVSGDMPSPSFIGTIVAVTIGLAILLYAAAVVRRLHDRGKSGAWGLLPLPFLLYLAALRL